MGIWFACQNSFAVRTGVAGFRDCPQTTATHHGRSKPHSQPPASRIVLGGEPNHPSPNQPTHHQTLTPKLATRPRRHLHAPQPSPTHAGRPKTRPARATNVSRFQKPVAPNSRRARRRTQHSLTPRRPTTRPTSRPLTKLHWLGTHSTPPTPSACICTSQSSELLFALNVSPRPHLRFSAHDAVSTFEVSCCGTA
jgi:hypothetical protein